MSDQKLRIGLASDHGGVELKDAIKTHIEEAGYAVVDLGTEGSASVDYPDFADKAARAVLDDTVDRAIVMCGTGIGISIAANRFKGIRAAAVWDCYTARMSRQHNDANILAIGGRVVTIDRAKEMVDIFLTTEFEGGRHQRRLDKIESNAE